MANFPRKTRVAVLLTASVVLASCGGGGDIENDLAFRMIHAAPDSPPVNFLVDGVALSAADYKGGTGFVFVTPRSYDLDFEARLPGGNELIINQVPTPLAAGREYTFIAIGKDETDTVRALIVDNPMEDIPDGNARLQIAHVAPDASPVDVYVTLAGASLPGTAPLAQVSYGEEPADRQLIPPGTYVIRVTPAGVPGTVLLDSGTLALRNRDDLLLIVAKNSVTGSSPITLLVNDRSVTREFLDKDTPSDLRVVHVSPDAPALDVVGTRPAPALPPEVTFATGLTYLGYTGYVSTPQDNYTIRGVRSSDADPKPEIFTSSQALFAGQRATLFVTGLLATIDDLVLVEDLRPIFAEGKLRIIHASPAGGTVDVYILPTGTSIADKDPTLSNVVLRQNTVHLPFEPDNYTVTFTAAGSKTPLATVEVAATAGTVQTAILVDEVRVDASSDGLPLGVLLLDDLSS